VGSRVRVQVSRVDLDGRKIDFRLVRDGEDDALLQRARRDRMADHASAELAAVKEIDRAAKGRTRKAAGNATRSKRAAKSTGRNGPGARAARKPASRS
jgi:ribonuclease R